MPEPSRPPAPVLRRHSRPALGLAKVGAALVALSAAACRPFDTAISTRVTARPGVAAERAATLLVELQVPPGATERTKTERAPLVPGTSLFPATDAGTATFTTLNIVANGRRGDALLTVQAQDAQNRPLGVGATRLGLVPGALHKQDIYLDPILPMRQDVVLSPGFALEATGRQVASAGDGRRFVVVWESCALAEPVACSIGGLHYGAAVSADGRFLDIASSSGSDDMPAVAMTPGGDFVVAWRRQASGRTPAIVALGFGASGAELGAGSVPLSAPTATEVANPDLVVLPPRDVASAPSYAVVWSQTMGSGAAARRQIAVARLEAAGLTLSVTALEVADETGEAYQLLQPAVAASAEGFAVSWIKQGPGTAEVFVRSYDDTGKRRGSEPLLLARSKQGLASGLDLSPLPAGGYLAIWHDLDEQGPDPSGRGIHARAFSAAPEPFDEVELIVNDEPGRSAATDNDQFDPILVRNSTLGLLALWTTQEPHDPAIRGLRLRKLDERGANRTDAADELTLLDPPPLTSGANQARPGAQRASACALDDHRILITFLRPLPNDASGRQFELMGRIYNGDGK